MSLLRRAFASFPGRSLLILIVLLVPWPGLGRTFASVVVGLNQAVLGDASSQVQLSFRLPRPGEAAGPWEMFAVARERDGKQWVATAVDTRRAGYLHDATFVALTLATPARRTTKAWILAIGLGALQLVPLLPALAFFSSATSGVQVFASSSLWHWLIEIAYRCLVAAPGMAYASGGLLWLLLVRWLAPDVL